jgi:transcriptional regulator with XRE-family HTH domain
VKRGRVIVSEAKTFGNTIRDLRINNTRYSLREFARLLDVSASYMSDVENDRRTPPKEETIIRIAELLKADVNELLAIARKMPPEFYDTFTKDKVYTQKVPEFLRRAKEHDVTEEEWNRLIEQVSKSKSSKGSGE